MAHNNALEREHGEWLRRRSRDVRVWDKATSLCGGDAALRSTRTLDDKHSATVNVLLDLDGTLTDPRDGILGCIRYSLAALNRNIPPDQRLLRYIGPPLQESFRELLGTADPKLIDIAMKSYRERFSSVGLYENSVYNGIPSALSRLRERGAELFVATSKPSVSATRIVEHFHLTKYFRAVYGSELDGTRTSKSELIAHIVSRAQLDPANTIMVGDRGHDVQGARANGIVPVGVLRGYGTAQELRESRDSPAPSRSGRRQNSSNSLRHRSRTRDAQWPSRGCGGHSWQAGVPCG